MGFNLDALLEPKKVRQWVLWRYDERKGKQTKVPYQPTGKKASTTSPMTWSTFEDVKAAYENGGFDGIGFVFTKECGITGVDLDHCRDPLTGEIDHWAKTYLDRLNSYSEISPSGEGVHILINAILLGDVDGRKKNLEGDVYRPKAAIEIYSHGRYFTITGTCLCEYPSTIEPRQEELTAIFEEVFGKVESEQQQTDSQPSCEITDAEIIDIAKNSRNGTIFSRLMDGDISNNKTHSEADQALVDILAFYSRDIIQIERIWGRSGLGKREKFQREDYRKRTIEAALRRVTEQYKSGFKSDSVSDRICEEELQDLPVVENPRLTVKLESDNAIMRYIEYGRATCDAYPEYHYGLALSLISIASNRNLVLRLKQGDVFPNVWAFLLGRSTISRKSAAASKGQRFADDLFPDTALPQSYSPEGLIEELTEKPRGYLIKDEAGAMLAAMQKNYMLEMRDLYCILYDCQSYTRKLRSGQRKERREFEVEKPFVNIVTATTPESFREYTSLLDLTSGWLLRFIYFYPNYKKNWMAFKPAGEEDHALYGEVLGRLSRIKGTFHDLEKPIEITLTQEAWNYYQAWQEAREGELQNSTDAIELALWGRLSFYALKLAMLFTVGRATYREDLPIGIAHIEEACRQIDQYFLPIGKLVAEEVAREETTNLQNKILGTLSRAGGKIRRRDLLKRLHSKLRDVDEALEALRESEEIKILVSGGKGGENVWILSNKININGPSEVRPKSISTDDLSQVSHLSTCINCRTNSEISTGIHGTDGASATFGTEGTVCDANQLNCELDRAGPHPRKPIVPVHFVEDCSPFHKDDVAGLGYDEARGDLLLWDPPVCIEIVETVSSGKGNSNKRCCACGSDLDGQGYGKSNGKLYCLKPGCFYPKRDSIKAEA